MPRVSSPRSPGRPRRPGDGSLHPRSVGKRVGHATGAAIPSILLVPTGRKGKYRVEGQIAIKVGADVLDVLRLVAEGRAPSDALLCRLRHVQVGPAQWESSSRGSPASRIRNAPPMESALREGEAERYRAICPAALIHRAWPTRWVAYSVGGGAARHECCHD